MVIWGSLVRYVFHPIGCSIVVRHAFIRNWISQPGHELCDRDREEPAGRIERGKLAPLHPRLDGAPILHHEDGHRIADERDGGGLFGFSIPSVEPQKRNDW